MLAPRRFRSWVAGGSPTSTQGRVGNFRPRKVGIPRYDLRDPYYTAVTAPWGLFFLAVLGLILLVNLLFGGLYLAEPAAVQNLPPGDYPAAFFFSLETMSTVGYGEMSPGSAYGRTIAGLEMFVGLGFTASLTGVLLARLSRPRARILFAAQPTLNEEDGAPVISIRVANGRQMLLTNATAVLSALLYRKDEAGDLVWEAHHLHLEQDQVSLFPLTWTVRHRLADASPLAAFKVDDFKAYDVKLYLMIMAHDPAINADVQAMGEWSSASLASGKRYAEAISRDEDGRILADLSRLSALAGDRQARAGSKAAEAVGDALPMPCGYGGLAIDYGASLMA